MYAFPAWVGGTAKVAAVALATAASAGAAAGDYLKLPPHLGEPPSYGDQAVMIEDPGLTAWREVIAGLGGLGATFVVPIAFSNPRAPTSAYSGYDDQVAQEVARLNAEIDAQMRDADLRRAQWARDAERDREMVAQAQLDRRVWESRGGGPATDGVQRYTGYGVQSVDAYGARYTSYPTEQAAPDVRRYTSYPAEPVNAPAEAAAYPGRAAPAETYRVVEAPTPVAGGG